MRSGRLGLDISIKLCYYEIMSEKSNSLITVGRTARLDIPVEGIKNVPAKIDTGADSSSIWASELCVDDDNVLSFCLFAKGSPYYTGKRHEARGYTAIGVRSAHGTLQVRYKIQMVVRLGGRRVRATFTLSDRSQNTYPVLIGCRLLSKKFLVDVSKGSRLATKKPIHGLRKELNQDPKAFFEKYHSNNHRGDVDL